MGLAALSPEGDSVFLTYPDRMANADVSAGLVLPYAAVAILRKVCTADRFYGHYLSKLS